MNQPISTLESEQARNVVYTEAEKAERRALGLPACEPSPAGLLRPSDNKRRAIKVRAIRAPKVLDEAPDYGSAFTRGLRVDFPNGITHLLISGTASVGNEGQTLYPGDFRAQCWRTFRNITLLLASEAADWRDVARTSCYLRDIDRDYHEFNHIRNEFYTALALDPFPASTGIQAGICRSDLLVEIEALAMLYSEPAG